MRQSSTRLSLAIPPWLTAVLLVLTLAACGGPGPQDVLARAERSIADRDYAAAVIDLKSLTEDEERAPRARWLLGQVYFEIGAYPGAVKEYSKAKQLGIDSEDVNHGLAACYLELGEFAKVLSLPPPRLGPSLADRTAQRALALLGLERYDEAAGMLDNTIASNPDHVPSIVTKARLLAIRGDAEGSRELVARALELEPDFARAWSLRADLDRKAGRLDDAEDALEKAVALRFANMRDLVRLALVEMEREKHDEAAGHVKQLIRRFPRSPDIRYVQGLYYYRTGDYTAAQNALGAALEIRKDYKQALFYLAATNYALKNQEQTIHYLREYLTLEPLNIAARKILGMQYLSAQNPQEAEQLVRPIMEAEPEDVVALEIVASALIAMGELDEGVDILERIIELDPEAAAPRVKLGAGLILQGRISTAEQNLRRVLELDPGAYRANQLLVRLYIKRKELEKAEATARAMLQSTGGETPIPYNMLATIALERGNKSGAAGFLKRALEISGSDAFANHQLAVLDLDAGNTKSARQRYRVVISGGNDLAVTYQRLAELEIAEGRPEQGRELLEKAIDKFPGELGPAVDLTNIYLQRGDPLKAQSTLALLRENFSRDPAWLFAYGRTQLALGDANGAIKSFQVLTDSGKAAASVWVALAVAYDMAGQLRNVGPAVERALQVDAEYLPAQLANVRVKIHDGRLAEAEDAARALEQRFPDNVEVVQAMLLLAKARGDAREVASVWARLYALDDSARHVAAYGQSLWNAGQKQKAMDVMRAWLDSHPFDSKVALGLANGLVGSGRHEQAVAWYEKVIERTPRNARALGGAAWALRNKNTARALQYAERAYAADSDSLPVLDTYGVVLGIAGDYDRANKMFERAMAVEPANAEVRYHLAQLRLREGKAAEASLLLKQALKDGQEFSEKAEAEALARRLFGNQ